MHFDKPRDSQVEPTLLPILFKSKIAVVVPCHNEQLNIAHVIDTLPDYIDKVVVVDDKSSDKTFEVTEKKAKQDKRVVLIRHEENQGVGGSIATGYEWCRDNDMDAAVVMAGDAQMDPVELPDLLKPVLVDSFDYSKGNRLIYQRAHQIIPKSRFFGNSVLSLLTKFSSGYWHIADSQCGYAVVNKAVLNTIDWQKMYKRYGQPNDLLVSLNIQNFSVVDVPVRPVYNVGEVSGIRIRKVVFTISNILIKKAAERYFLKYVVYDFHPLILFLAFSVFMLLLAVIFFVNTIWGWVSHGQAPVLSSLAFLFCLSFSVNSFFFSMWMDMSENRSTRTPRK